MKPKSWANYIGFHPSSKLHRFFHVSLFKPLVNHSTPVTSASLNSRYWLVWTGAALLLGDRNRQSNSSARTLHLQLQGISGVQTTPVCNTERAKSVDPIPTGRGIRGTSCAFVLGISQPSWTNPWQKITAATVASLHLMQINIRQLQAVSAADCKAAKSHSLGFQVRNPWMMWRLTTNPHTPTCHVICLWQGMKFNANFFCSNF